MFRYSMVLSLLITSACINLSRAADESRFTKTGSRSQYVHWIDLYDAEDRIIDPSSETAAPYSPQFTCGRCHDYAAIAGGHHFNAIRKDAAPGRPGEPWIWTDPRTGTQIPLSYRGWPGTYDPGALGISARDFVLKFGRQLPGGGPGEAAAAAPKAAPDAAKPKEGSKDEPSKAAKEAQRWKLSGLLNVDCMICHGNSHQYSQEAWWNQIQRENFAWAPTAALGLGSVEGDVSKLPDDFDPAQAKADSRHKLPSTKYTPARINGEKKVFFDVVRKSNDNACYYCHSTLYVGEEAPPEWTRDEDVHLRAGFTCADCHSNEIAHHTVRGFEGEVHPTGQDVATLSCRGCHMNDGHGGGRMGAPKPLHRGLPPVHLEKLSCTACHCGPEPKEHTALVHTSMAHGLGIPSHEAGPQPPGIATSVMLRGGDDMLYPHRIVWPAFWAKKTGDAIVPFNPDEVYEATRKTLRVRRGSGFRETMMEAKLSADDKKAILGDRAGVKDEELTAEEKAKLEQAIAERGRESWRQKLVAALGDLKKLVTAADAEPVLVSAGKVYRLSGEDDVESFEHDAAKPYTWKFGHDVRPARLSLGSKGCYDCHTLGAPLFESIVTASGQAPDDAPITRTMHQMAGYDKLKLDAWAVSFLGRTAFKYFGYASMGVVGLVLLAYTLLGIVGLFPSARRQ